jgi:predicted phosphodiesterase
MRVAVLNDIHGNLPALDAVLSEVRSAGAHAIVVGGDVLPGPMFRETLAALSSLDVPVHFIQGNCEVAVLEERAGALSEPLPPHALEIVRWTAKELTAEAAHRIASWPMTLRLHVDPIGDVLFCHGTPRHHNEIVTAATPDDLLRPKVDPLNVAMIVCGHTHMQFDRMVGRTRVINSGSVGMPFGEPGADWLLIADDPQLRHTTYNLAAAADLVRQTDYPHAEEFAANYILEPPSAVQMLDAFARAQLRYAPT